MEHVGSGDNIVANVELAEYGEALDAHELYADVKTCKLEQIMHE